MFKKLAWTGSLSSLYTYFKEITKTEFELRIDIKFYVSILWLT